MKIQWCEVHKAAVYEPLPGRLNPAATLGVCIIESDFGLDDPANCKLVAMRLIPDHAVADLKEALEAAEDLAGYFPAASTEGHWFRLLEAAARRWYEGTS